jgi:hypothetical protein
VSGINRAPQAIKRVPTAVKFDIRGPQLANDISYLDRLEAP